MKLILFIFILFLLPRQFYSQTFKQYKQTPFQFISTDKKLDGRPTPNAYIKKGDTVLIISKADLNIFLALFEKSPSCFTDLFKKLPWVSNKHINSDRLDKILRQTSYKIHADVSTNPMRNENDKVILDLINTDYVTASSPCYLNIFIKLKDKTQNDITNINNLDQIDVVNNYCEY